MKGPQFAIDKKALKKMQKITKPMRDAIRRSETLSAKDYAVTINVTRLRRPSK